MNPSRRHQLPPIDDYVSCPKCHAIVYYADGIYKSEVIRPHGYVAPIHYYRCKVCHNEFKGD